MARIENLHIYGDAEKLKYLKEEYDYIGRNATRMVDSNHLVVLVLPPKRKRKRDDSNERAAVGGSTDRGHGRKTGYSSKRR